VRKVVFVLETGDDAAVRLAILAALCVAQAAGQNGWHLVWSDEFEGPAGSKPDPSKWNFDLGGGGWGNGELQVYTDSARNAFLDGDGHLVIRALRDENGNYTSARLQTGAPGASLGTAGGKWQYGRIEVRAKLPSAKGVWPAFWMLGESFRAAGWPACGEIDILENFGTFRGNERLNNGSAHGPGYSGGKSITSTYQLKGEGKVSDGFHVYGVEWRGNSVAWYVDGEIYFTVTPASLPAGSKWVFNAPFFLLLNVAVGAPRTFLGAPDESVKFPQEMLVDWARVYQQ
jgi:beta-glucanase (GH16 family)